MLTVLESALNNLIVNDKIRMSWLCGRGYKFYYDDGYYFYCDGIEGNRYDSLSECIRAVFNCYSSTEGIQMLFEEGE